MGKTARRIALDDACDIGHNESWFSAMAQDGLHLKKYGRMFIHFERGEPRNTKYRAEIVNGKPTEEQLSLYRECGWEYVTSSKFIAIFSADGNADIAELHTDPVEQSYTLEAASKGTRSSTIIMAVCVAIITLLIMSTVVFSPEPVYTMVTGQFLQQLCLVIIELYLFFIMLNNHLTLLKLKKKLQAGIPICHDLPYKAHRRVAGTIALLFLLFSLAVIVLPITSLIKQERYLLPDGSVPLPILRLAEVEQNPALVRKEMPDRDNFDRANSVRYEWSPLAPVQYTVEESGRMPGVNWSDNSGEYSPILLTQYYELTFSGMAKPLMNDLIHRYAYRFDRQETSEIFTPLFDEVQVNKTVSSTSIFARKGNAVIFIIYHGTGTPESLLSLLSDRMST